MRSITIVSRLSRAVVAPTTRLVRFKATTTQPGVASFDKEDEKQKEEVFPYSISNRFRVTAEVVVSKIFPAGFGWQTASCIADDAGLQTTDVGFFAATGFGDFMGVFIGHSLFYAGKKITVDDSIDLAREAQTGLLLGSAAFCSGFVWQPVVSNLQELTNMNFNATVAGTTAACGLAFFGGLRVFRRIYGNILPAVEAPDYNNIKADAQLSFAIGGATGAFVGTDVAFGAGASDPNWLRPLVGIEESASVLQGACTAGVSTSIGFLTVQSGENLSRSKNWTD